MDLCHWIIAHPPSYYTPFTGEAYFTEGGIKNAQNLHTWSHENPREANVTNFQGTFLANIWCDLLGGKLIEPFVSDINLTADTCEFILRIELTGLSEDILFVVGSQMYFQHDGAPAKLHLAHERVLTQISG